MEIDLSQLPIPDWGLLCPHCRYPLVGLPEHRCPECGKRFSIDKLVNTWTRLRDPSFTGHELPFPDFGLHCLNCQQPLAGCECHACRHCGASFHPDELRPDRAWFLIDQDLAGDVPLPGLESLLASEYVPFYRETGKLVREIYMGPKTIGSRLRAPREFYFDVLWLIRKASLDMHQVRVGGEQADWTCPSCGEPVPAHFDLCWNCESARPE